MYNCFYKILTLDGHCLFWEAVCYAGGREASLLRCQGRMVIMHPSSILYSKLATQQTTGLQILKHPIYFPNKLQFKVYTSQLTSQVEEKKIIRYSPSPGCQACLETRRLYLHDRTFSSSLRFLSFPQWFLFPTLAPASWKLIQSQGLLGGILKVLGTRDKKGWKLWWGVSFFRLLGLNWMCQTKWSIL